MTSHKPRRIVRPDQSRPDQSRPDLARPDLARRVLLSGLLCAGAGMATPSLLAASTRRPPSDAGWQRLVSAAARQTRAGAILAVDGCGPAFLGAAGVAERRTRAPMPVEAPVRAGSVGKLAVAALVLQLAADGRLDLSAPARTRLPAGTLDGIAGADATVRQLLNHTGGVPDYYTDATIRSWDWRLPLTAGRVLDAVRGLPATGVPGATYAYSNTGYQILGLIAEAAGGAPLGELLARHVFAPAGLQDARYHTGNPGGPIHGYGTPDDPAADTWAYSENTGADSGITAPVTDLARLLRALFLPDGTLAAIGAAMLADPVPTGRERRLAGLGPEIAIGRDGTRLVGHTGDVAGYLTFAYAAPDLRATLVAHLNADRPDVLATLLRATVDRLRAGCPG